MKLGYSVVMKTKFTRLQSAARLNCRCVVRMARAASREARRFSCSSDYYRGRKGAFMIAARILQADYDPRAAAAHSLACDRRIELRRARLRGLYD